MSARDFERRSTYEREYDDRIERDELSTLWFYNFSTGGYDKPTKLISIKLPNVKALTCRASIDANGGRC